MNLWVFLLVLAANSGQADEILEPAATSTDVETPVAAKQADWPEGDADAGFELYAEGCRGCHSGVIAPSLKGVFGRPVAGVEGYSYSEGLSAHSGESWSDETLHAFLSDPSIFASGSKMRKKLPDAQDRADIIAFLKTLPE